MIPWEFPMTGQTPWNDFVPITVNSWISITNTNKNYKVTEKFLLE
jgi:hypothetical protein